MAKEETKKIHKFFQLVPPGTNIGFIEHRWRFISVSLLLVVLSVAALIYNQITIGSPLTMGIDFAGGSQVQLAFAEGKGIEVEQVRAALEELGYEGSSAVEVPDRDNEVLIRIKESVSIDDSTLQACEAAVQQVGGAKLVDFNHPEGGSKLFLSFDAEPNYREVARLLGAAGCQGEADKGMSTDLVTSGEGDEQAETFPVDVALIGIGAKVRDDIEAKLGAGTVDHIVGSETVGSKVGDQLATDGIKSLLFAVGFIFLYVMLRFDLRFAPGGIIALTHDAFLMVGAFAITGKEFNLQTIAAILTIIGYSINDTIVVFDRIRERVALRHDESLDVTANTAINETLSRTLLTTLTTLVVVVAIFVLGSGPIKDFAFALIVGLVVGTYSSIAIASPILLWVNRRFYAGKGHLQWAEQREGTGTLLGDNEPRPALAEKSEAAEGGEGEERVEVDAEEVAAAEADALAGVRKTGRRRRRRRPEGGPTES